MGRAAYIRRRLILMVFVLFGVTVLIFSMVHFLPGDPAAVLLGDRATAQNIALLHDQLGLNRPLPEQYWLFVSGLVRGEMGTSLTFRQPVSQLVLSRVPITLGLAVYAMGLAAIVTLVFGLLAAVNQGRWLDQMIRVVFLFILTTPNFWFGILLILLLSLGLRWFPVAGFGATLQEHVWYLFLPALTLTLFFYGGYLLLTRATVLETLSEDYITTARAKGLSERTVVFKHALKNAALPLVTASALQFGFLLGGAIITETVFSWDGLGYWLYQAIGWKDGPVMQAMFFIIALCVITANFASDILYGLIDPRIKYE